VAREHALRRPAEHLVEARLQFVEIRVGGLQESLRVPVATHGGAAGLAPDHRGLRHTRHAEERRRSVVAEVAVEDPLQDLQVRLPGDPGARHDLLDLAGHQQSVGAVPVAQGPVAHVVARAPQPDAISDREGVRSAEAVEDALSFGSEPGGHDARWVGGSHGGARRPSLGNEVIEVIERARERDREIGLVGQR
jgi:hypothetical protein